MPTVTAHVTKAQADWIKRNGINKSQLMQRAIEVLMQRRMDAKG